MLRVLNIPVLRVVNIESQVGNSSKKTIASSSCNFINVSIIPSET